ncbi:MAG: hypothetical protein ABR581_11670 [Thermoleophilaceae bacterium]
MRLQAAGASGRYPHEPDAWRAFQDHLAVYKQDELIYLQELLRMLAKSPAPDAPTLLERAEEAWPEWGGATLESNLAARVARLREWGLLEPKLPSGRYALTELGRNEAGRSAT